MGTAKSARNKDTKSVQTEHMLSVAKDYIDGASAERKGFVATPFSNVLEAPCFGGSRVTRCVDGVCASDALLPQPARSEIVST